MSLLGDILALIDPIEPIAEGDYEQYTENARDGGNFDDAFDSGVDFGYRMLAEAIRKAIEDNA